MEARSVYVVTETRFVDDYKPRGHWSETEVVGAYLLEEQAETCADRLRIAAAREYETCGAGDSHDSAAADDAAWCLANYDELVTGEFVMCRHMVEVTKVVIE